MKLMMGLVSLVVFLYGANITQERETNLSLTQEQNIKMAYDIGKDIVAKDGMTFGYALSTVILNETSGGMALIGDKYEDIYYIIHNMVEIRIPKTRDTHMEFHGYSKKIRIHKGKLKPIDECSLGKFQVKLSTAKDMIRQYEHLAKYRRYLRDDAKLINVLLLYDKRSALIAGTYLLNRYELAQRKGLSKPYWRAISAYNGGWNNTKYKNDFKRNRKIVDAVSRKNSW